MRGAWAVMAMCSAAGVAAGLLLARRTISKSMAAMPAWGEARRTAAHGMRARVGRVSASSAVIGALVGLVWNSVAGGREDRHETDGILWIMCAAVAAALSAVPLLLDAEGELQGPGWNRRAAARMWLFATMSANGFAMCVGGVCAAVTAAWIGEHPHAAWAAADAFAVGGLVGLLVQGRVFAAVGRLEPFDAEIAAEAAKAAGDGPPVSVLLWRTGRGVWNAFALKVRRSSRILVSEDLVALLPRDEMVALLLHEMGHLRLRHIGVRKLVLIGALAGVPLVFAALGIVSPGWMTVIAILVASAAGRLWRRQEIAADAFAASRGCAAPLGRALVRMERAKLLPEAQAAALTHPALRDRLVRLGLDADALLLGDGASGAPGAPGESLVARS